MTFAYDFNFSTFALTGITPGFGRGKGCIYVSLGQVELTVLV